MCLSCNPVLFRFNADCTGFHSINNIISYTDGFIHSIISIGHIYVRRKNVHGGQIYVIRLDADSHTGSDTQHMKIVECIAVIPRHISITPGKSGLC